MSKFISSYDGDIKIQAKNNGEIVLGFFEDPATLQSTGTVTIGGDLVVQGTTTTVNSQEMTVVDRLITLNQGETGNGVTLADGVTKSIAGIVIDRGTADNASIFYNELRSFYDGYNNSTSTGAWEIAFTDANDSPSIGEIPLYARQIVSNIDLYFDTGSGQGVLKAKVDPSSPSDYHERVLYYDPNTNLVDIDPASNPPSAIRYLNALPTMQAVQDYITFVNSSGTTISAIGEGDSRVVVSDDSVSGTDSTITAELNGSQVLRITDIGNNGDFRTDIMDLEIQGSRIRSTNSGEKLQLQGWEGVEIDNVLEIKGYTTDGAGNYDPAPLWPMHGIKLYSKPASAGNVGLYYVNSKQTEDELISKNRALLFGMLF